jgi:hypothetical protein
MAPRPTADAAHAVRSGLLIGAAGRLGEALLERLAARGPIHVAVTAPFTSTFGNVVPWSMSAEAATETTALPPVDDLWCVTGGAPGFHRRDAAYRAFDRAEAVALARAAHRAGVRRVVSIAPLAALHQLNADGLGLADLDEARIVAMGFEAAVFVRPTPDEVRTRAGTWPERLAQWWLGTLAHYLTPRALAPMDSATAARAIVEATAPLLRGDHVIGASRLQAALGHSGSRASIRR